MTCTTHAICNNDPNTKWGIPAECCFCHPHEGCEFDKPTHTGSELSDIEEGV